tara:strand:+ start:165 stop:875 length:711 start_codon:yes stop_codon:yes gene_type:complete
MLGDCLERIKEIESGSVDMILTDPPYGTTACKWDSVIDFELMWEQLNRIIKPNGAIVLFGSEPFSSALRMSNIKNYKYDWIWEKTRPSGHLNAKKRPLKTVENICIFYKKQCLYNPQGLIEGVFDNNRPWREKYSRREDSVYGKQKKQELSKFTNYPKEVLKYSNPNNNRLHPTQKPVALMEYLIKTYTNESETVLDFTMGSGTTGVAAKNLNRKFIGIEMDEGYFNIAKKRIEEA